MQIRFGNFWQNSRAHLKTGWLITAGLVALYLGAIEPLENAREINNQKAAGLAPATERRAFSLSSPNRLRASGSAAGGVVGGVPGAVSQPAMMTFSATPAAVPHDASEDRKLIRTGAMDLVVKNPGEAVEKVRGLAERTGGFLQSSSGRQCNPNACTSASALRDTLSATISNLFGQSFELGLLLLDLATDVIQLVADS